MDKLDLDELLKLNPHLDKKHFKNKRKATRVTKKATSSGGIASPYADRGNTGKPKQNWERVTDREFRPHYRPI